MQRDVNLLTDLFGLIHPVWWFIMFIELYGKNLLTHRFSYADFGSVSIFTAMFYIIGGWFFMRAKPAFGDIL